MSLTMQYFDHGESTITFVDQGEGVHSKMCHPRDILIISGEDTARLREEIAIDVRLGQGANPIGVARDLHHR